MQKEVRLDFAIATNYVRTRKKQVVREMTFPAQIARVSSYCLARLTVAQRLWIACP